jgi:hypothetical protein
MVSPLPECGQEARMMTIAEYYGGSTELAAFEEGLQSFGPHRPTVPTFKENENFT